MEPTLSPNTLAFIALCNEYCAAVENAAKTERDEFINEMLRFLPRIYITISDVKDDILGSDGGIFINESLDEDYYESVRRSMEMLFSADDSYLEVFEEDMKYSDTPISASISEGLADIFQVLYNFVNNVKDAPTDSIPEFLAAVKEDFEAYWSQKLCNVLRAINAVKYNSTY